MEYLMKEVIKFRDDRGWSKFHNPKDLSISLSLEANELLENFQWKTNEEALKNIESIKDELADVIIYSLLLSHELDLNIDEIVRLKIVKNNAKYPIEKAYGSNKKYTEL